MPIPEEFRLIIDRLEKATDEGRANWLESGRTNEFYIVFKAFSLRISYHPSERDADSMRVGLADSNGATISAFEIPLDHQEQNDFVRLKSMWSKALRRARKVDETLKQLADELESGGPVGEGGVPF
jgi:hypothetical protein